MSESETLKPCPFCGGKATRTTMRKFKYVSCENSDCSMVVEAGALFSREEEAIAAWNTRAGEQAAYERGKAEGREAERGRIVEVLQPTHDGYLREMEAEKEDGDEERAYYYYALAREIDYAINIVNQAE